MKSLLFSSALALFWTVGAIAQTPDSTDRDALELMPERELMQDPAIEPTTPSEFEQPDVEMPITDPSETPDLSPEYGDPETSEYLNPQPAKQPEPGDTTRIPRPNR